MIGVSEEFETDLTESEKEFLSQRDRELEQIRAMFKRVGEAMEVISKVGLDEENPVIRTSYLENVIVALIMTSNLCGYFRMGLLDWVKYRLWKMSEIQAERFKLEKAPKYSKERYVV